MLMDVMDDWKSPTRPFIAHSKMFCKVELSKATEFSLDSPQVHTGGVLLPTQCTNVNLIPFILHYSGVDCISSLPGMRGNLFP